MTTFSEMKILMEQNGWVQIEKKSEYEKIKKANKQITARIGWIYFKLKEEKKGCGKEVYYYYSTAGKPEVHKHKIGNCGDKLQGFGQRGQILLCSECRRLK
jgi:hypothetical protein